MPVYTVACKTELAYEQRKKAADKITDIHCEITGAPSEFVNVVFMNGHRIKRGMTLGVVGTVREGGNRNKEMTDSLRDSIHQGVAEATNVAASEISVALVGAPASAAMEGGEILPEPGEEAAWLARTSGSKAK